MALLWMHSISTRSQITLMGCSSHRVAPPPSCNPNQGFSSSLSQASQGKLALQIWQMCRLRLRTAFPPPKTQDFPLPTDPFVDAREADARGRGRQPQPLGLQSLRRRSRCGEERQGPSHGSSEEGHPRVSTRMRPADPSDRVCVCVWYLLATKACCWGLLATVNGFEGVQSELEAT